MSDSPIFTFVTSAEDLGGRTVLIRVGVKTWRFIRTQAISIGHAIERAGAASDRRRLQLLCEQRYRRWD
jgi:hypothetical protein